MVFVIIVKKAQEEGGEEDLEMFTNLWKNFALSQGYFGGLS